MWVKLDDKFHSNLKVLEVGFAAAGLYARALSFCGDQLTDGVVPASWLRIAGAPAELVQTLTDHGFWEPITKGDHRYIHRDNGDRIDVTAVADGHFIRDFLKINPSRAEVEQQRSSRAVAGRKGALSRWGSADSRSAHEQGEHGTRHGRRDSSAYGDRTPPDPTLKEKDPSTKKQDPPREAEPLRCNAPDRPCPTLTFTNERELRDHLQAIHWLEPDQIDHLLGDDDWDAIDAAAQGGEVEGG